MVMIAGLRLYSAGTLSPGAPTGAAAPLETAGSIAELVTDTTLEVIAMNAGMDPVPLAIQPLLHLAVQLLDSLLLHLGQPRPRLHTALQMDLS